MELHAQIACAMPRELAGKGIGWRDRAVYTEAIYYGRENLTDGLIARAELGFWMPDMPIRERVKRLEALADAGALQRVVNGWTFPDHVWRKWGSTRAQVEDKRRAEAERVAAYRAKKAKAATRDDAAVYANGTTVRTRSVTDAYATPYPEPEPEPKPEPSTTSAEPPTLALVLPEQPAPGPAPRKRDELYDAVVTACGWDYEQMTKRQRSTCGVATAELRAVGATAEQVALRADRYRRRYQRAALTPSALASQWAALTAQAAHPSTGTPELGKSSAAFVNVVNRRRGAS